MRKSDAAAGAASATRSGLKVRLRPTMLSDLDFVQSVENDPANRPFITPWERVQHEGAIRIPDFRHFIAEAGEGWPSAGFVILQGCRNPHAAVELKRIVIQPKGLGYGRALVRLLAEMAFRDLGAHRFWLDVKESNARALALYRDEGFVEEGRLRDSVKTEGGWQSLVVLSMLRDEHAAHLAAAAAVPKEKP